MSANIEIISLLVPKNNANFAVADVNHLKGGYILVDTYDEMQECLLYTNRLKEGMLCYVKANNRLYLLVDNSWKIWQVESGTSMSLMTVDKLEDLYGTTLEVRGQVVFVAELDALRYYTGTKWAAFSRIYIQDKAPDDTSGVWIDTSDVGLNESSSVANELYKMINILARKVAILEFRNLQVNSGLFDNNMYDLYDNIYGTDPGPEISGFEDIFDGEESDGTTEAEDYTEEQLLHNTLLADSEEPVYYKDLTPNVKHILIKWGSTNDMFKYKDNFLPAELLFCFNTNELYIKHPKTLQLIKIGATGGGTIDPDNPDIEDIMNGIIQSGDYISSISFVDMSNPDKHWTFGVNNGELSLYNEELNSEPVANKLPAGTDAGYYKEPYLPTTNKGYNGSAFNSMLFINMIYASGNVTNDYNPCNYNFIEISNLSPYDVNLNGFYLHYSEGYTSSVRKWISLPLKGVIKAKNTYLIKGARAGLDKFARVKVGKPDIYFSKHVAYNSDIFDTNLYSIWDSEGMLKINNNCALFLTGPMYATPDSNTYTDRTYTEYMLKEGPYSTSAPWLKGDTFQVVRGYCDCQGFGNAKSGNDTKNMPTNSSTAGPVLNADSIYHVYYSMDNVSLAYKTIIGDNKTTWTRINLLTPDPAIDVEKYIPKNSTEGKSIFFNKHLIEDGIPTFVNCTFGYNPHTTRCFTWVSKGYRNEYLRYRKQGLSEWITVESFKTGDKRSSKYNRNNAIYDRLRSVTTDGTYFTTHKYILDLYAPFDGSNNLTDGPASKETYEYQVGYKDNWTDIKTFTLHNRQDVINNGFQFLLVTDLQGFNQEEYEEWRLVAEYINKHYSNAYSYEPFDDDIEHALYVTSLPNATSLSPEYVCILSGYYKKSFKEELDVYSYKKTTTYENLVDEDGKLNLPEGISSFVTKLPIASKTSANSVLVCDYWKLEEVEGEKKYIDKTGEEADDYTWPLNPVYVTEVPSEITDESPVDIIVCNYYEKLVKHTYTYDKINEPGEGSVSLTKLPKTVTETSPEYVTVIDDFRYKKVLNDIEFTVNTGDATLNGNRVNEWIDYFKAGDSLFNHLEQLYSVGNNDLCPTLPYELGLGTDTTKQNPININYFFTFEHPFEIPQSTYLVNRLDAEGKEVKDADGNVIKDEKHVYVPCIYSYIYGNTYFLCANSELTDSGDACKALFGVQVAPLYLQLKVWMQTDVDRYATNWKIAFCHESPFTILIKATMDDYVNKLKDNPNYKAADRGSVTSHFNSPGGFWFAPFLEDNAFNLCICGHKHTYATCRYLHDNPEDRMKIHVYDPDGENASFITNDNKPFIHVTNDTTMHYVKYTMCQASGYKLVSNKELPYYNIGWIEEYYSTNGSTASAGQRFPHFIIWEVGKGTETEDPSVKVEERERIIGKAKKVYPSKYALSGASNKLFNYNSLNFTSDEMLVTGGNGPDNPDNNIIVVKLPYTEPVENPTFTLTWTGDTDKVEGGTEAGSYLSGTVINYPTAISGYRIEFDKAPSTLEENTVINIIATELPPILPELEEGEVMLNAEVTSNDGDEVTLLNTN